MTIWFTECTPPRSTCQDCVPIAPSEHHLSVNPPVMLPLTALAGPSLALHELSAVAGWFSARLFGTAPPPLDAGGAGAAARAHQVGVETSAESHVQPFCPMAAAIPLFLLAGPV